MRSAIAVLVCTTSNARVGLGTLIPDGEYCEDCYPAEDEDGYDDYDLIHSWDYALAPIHGEGPLFLGIELEMSAPWGRRSDAARIAQDYLGDLGYLKSDGSPGVRVRAGDTSDESPVGAGELSVADVGEPTS